MAEILSEKTRSNRERDRLRDEGTPVADDLLGRLNAMDFIDSVLGEDFELPSRIGDYEISGVLGRGGMGTVYKAYQANLDREIALKVLAPRFSSDVTMRKRFRTEAKATAAMHHRHIVPIYGYGEASGHLFFAMELVSGVSLDKHITVARRKGMGAMEPEDAARRFAGVADALALAHQRKILHRDVKPGNLLMHEDGTLALADFGLSKFLGEVSAHLTSVGGFLGTLHYAPPEQARGEELGPASDLYSVGVTLFETVTGKLPVYGQTTEAMLHAVLHDEPLRLRQVMPKAPRDLEAVLAKLLQKDPRDRYQDGESLGLDLIRIAEGEPVRIRRQALIPRLYRRARRNPVVTAAIGVALILVVVTGLWFQSLWVNKAIQLEKSGREHLARASVAVSREPGSPVGPFRMLDALSGAATAEADASSEFLIELAAAESELPAATGALLAYRDAYLGRALKAEAAGDSDPLEDLRAGNGVRAVEALGERIKAIEGQFQTDDLGIRIDLYNLYLARAMAAITASVADPQQARNDLSLAAFIRSGAILPRMLRAFLNWDPTTQPQRLLDQLKAYLGEDMPGVRRATGEFLLSFAGVGAPSSSHLMRFEMDYSSRRLFSSRALELLGVDPTDREDWYSGLEFELAEHAAVVLKNLGNSLAMSGPMRAARNLLRTSVGDGSSLRSWEYTFDLLADEPGTGAQMAPEHRLRGAIQFVRVVQRTLPVHQAELILRNLEPQLADLLARADGEPVPGADEERLLAIELRSRLWSWIADPAEAERAAEAWLKVDDRHPEAQLCKFCGLIRAEPKTPEAHFRALVPGADAMRYAVGREHFRRCLLDRLQHGLAVLDPDAEARPWLEKLRRTLGGNGG